MTEELELQIARYLDGEMDAVERAKFDMDIARQPELAQTIQQWRDNDNVLRTLIAERPADAALLARLGLADAESAPTATVIDFATARAARVTHAPPGTAAGSRPRRGWIAGGAIAAALALAVTVKMMLATPGLSNDPAFQLAMQRSASGQRMTLEAGTVVPSLSFAANDGRYCREYRVEGDKASAGIACRGDRRWTIEAEVKMALAPTATGIVAASGDQSNAIDAAYTRLRGGDPMDAAQERTLIASGWRAR